MYKSVRYSQFTTARCFGVELEVGNSVPRDVLWEITSDHTARKIVVSEWNQTHDNGWWHIKTDSTCGPLGKGHDHGYEIASFKGSGVYDLMHIAEVAGHLRYAGVEVNDNCGLHVHADVSDFRTADMGVLLARWCQVEDFLLACVPSRRRLSPYCSPLRRIRHLDDEIRYNCEEFWDLFKPKDLSVFMNPERQVALNVMNYATGLVRRNWTRSTVELRLPEGTLDPYHVRNWARMFVNFVENCKGKPMPRSLSLGGVGDALSVLGLGHDAAFHIFSPGLTETRRWLLERCVTHGPEPWNRRARRAFDYITSL